MTALETSGIALTRQIEEESLRGAQRMNEEMFRVFREDTEFRESAVRLRAGLGRAVVDGSLTAHDADVEMARFLAERRQRQATALMYDVMLPPHVRMGPMGRLDVLYGQAIPQSVMMEALEPAPEPRQAQTAVVERPVGTKWQVPGPVPTPEYFELARKIGLQSLPVVKARVEHFLANVVGWPVFQQDRVMAYLQYIADRDTNWSGHPLSERTRPTWLPFREKDRKGLGGFRELYEREVPLDALQKIDRVETEFPNAPISFWVSDYKVERPDPFLKMVICQNPAAEYVIAVWDEPGWVG